ncbi:MAG TPA: response regulator, partial [Gemmatimonadales bacterium]|nr:response regulator [Gemmatimonadales bacterium]
MTTTPIKVLLVEDNPGDVRLIRETVLGSAAARFEVESAERLADGVARLSGGDIDVVLLDLELPDSRGYETFERVHASVPRLPIIVLTGL